MGYVGVFFLIFVFLVYNDKKIEIIEVEYNILGIYLNIISLFEWFVDRYLFINFNKLFIWKYFK